MSEETAEPGPTRKPTANLCKVVAFTNAPEETDDSRLVEELGAIGHRLVEAGIRCQRARAQVFSLARFDGRELVKYRTDLLPGQVPPSAVMCWFDLQPGSQLAVAEVGTALEPTGWHHLSILDEYLQYTSEQWGNRPSEIVRLGLISRLPELTRAEFATHWIDRHGPLVVEHKPLYDMYVSNVLTYPEQPWDGVVEHWFADEATWREHDRRNLEEKPDVIASARSGSQMQQFAGTPGLLLDLPIKS